MSSSVDVHTPRKLDINGLWQFFPEMVFREGESDPPPLGPFRVRGDYKVKSTELDAPIQRFLILRPEEGCTLPSYNEYAVEYPEKLIAGVSVIFERKRSALRIRMKLSKKGLCFLELHDHQRPVSEYVLYEQQVEGTWIPIEVDGKPLRP